MDEKLLELLDSYRKAKHTLAEYVQTKRDLAFMHDLEAHIANTQADYAVKEVAEDPTISEDD